MIELAKAREDAITYQEQRNIAVQLLETADEEFGTDLVNEFWKEADKAEDRIDGKFTEEVSDNGY